MSRIVKSAGYRGGAMQDALFSALRVGDRAAVEALVPSGPVVLPGDLSALMVAGAAGHADLVSLLLARGGAPTERRGNAFTALHAAAMAGQDAVVARLLQAGADPNARTDPQRYSPLHSAAFGGHEAAVRLLVDAGAMLGVRNYRDETPADTARRTGKLATAALLDSVASGVSPRIDAFAWGRVDIAAVGTVKDARLFPGGAEAWDWSRTGTRHVPGVQFVDVEDLLAYRPTTVLLSRGVDLVLHVPRATVDAVRTRGPEVQVLQSEALVAVYNRLAARERVVALLHSTC